MVHLLEYADKGSDLPLTDSVGTPDDVASWRAAREKHQEDEQRSSGPPSGLLAEHSVKRPVENGQEGIHLLLLAVIAVRQPSLRYRVHGLSVKVDPASPPVDLCPRRRKWQRVDDK